MSIEEVFKEHATFIEGITRADPTIMKVFKEVTMKCYVKGFFGGMRHAMMDAEEKEILAIVDARPAPRLRGK